MSNEKDVKEMEETVKEQKVEDQINEMVEDDKREEQSPDGGEETEGKKDRLSELEEQIAKLKEELEEKENRLLRIQADFDNYRKRTRNEIANLEKYQSQDLAVDLLTTVDNFERALNTDVTSDEANSLLQGMEMVYRGMLDVFKKHGIEPIESVGKPFDPHFHHAVMQEHNEEYEENVVLEEFQKGYILKDRVIRPAMVKVNE